MIGRSNGGRLADRVALITGAASGFGRTTAERFVEEGAKVAVVDWSEELGREVAKELGDAAIFIRCDVSDRAQDEAAVAEVVQRWGRLDIVYNNAALGWSGGMETIDDPTLEHMMAVNVLGPWRMSEAALPALRRTGAERAEGAVLLFTASVLGLMAIPKISPYTVSKFGIVGMMRSLAIDEGPNNIRVNAICPGLSDTPGMRRDSVKWGNPEDSLKYWRSRTPLGRLATSLDIANAAVFLASDEARSINSLALVVDGGESGR
ncbi:SDR family NAD(P)-dependent oxidoreductase [Kribbella sp. VKM Ac-2566]|uniref:SDR family NAD(P)-dependent oxidoreductase n=1 Tax=Kribbella sp. VKM Ac-2566 TaxID=2512218 RepID=UPI001063C978|nr:SDR family oxidoreductase [Kribbella sp. VKM Ac-2566]TDX08282.1 3-oxoacyl-[acyl-carrier protein] reductase [Kribbella sp. VKM Ac-2566]